MPSIRSQSFTITDNDHGSVDLVVGGTGDHIVIDVSRSLSGANTLITITTILNSVQSDSTVLTNPTIAQVEQFVQDRVFGIVGVRFQFKFHVFTLNPLSATIRIFNPEAIVPAIWWPT